MKTFGKCKRLLSLLMFVLMIVQLVSATAFAEEPENTALNEIADSETTEEFVVEETLPLADSQTAEIPGGGIP